MTVSLNALIANVSVVSPPCIKLWLLFAWQGVVVHDASGTHDRRPVFGFRKSRQAQDAQMPQERRQPEVALQPTGTSMTLLC